MWGWKLHRKLTHVFLTPEINREWIGWDNNRFNAQGRSNACQLLFGVLLVCSCSSAPPKIGDRSYK